MAAADVCRERLPDVARKLNLLSTTPCESEVVQLDSPAPPGYALEDEGVVFDESIHLALGTPERLVDLKKFGYSDEELSALPCTFGQSSTFRLLSDEGLAATRSILKRLDQYCVKCARIPRVLRGAVYRSRFLRELVHSKALLAYVSKMAGCGLAPHPMMLHGAHTNFKPLVDQKENIDKWHFDTVAFVVVLFITEHTEYEGGEFQYFLGTRAEALELMKDRTPLPAERCFSAGQQTAGYALFQQGQMVMHRATAVTQGDERTTVVFSFTPTNPFAWDAIWNLHETYNGIDPFCALLPEWMRFRAWKAARQLRYWREWSGAEAELAEGTAPSELVALVGRVKEAEERLDRLVVAPPMTDERSVLVGEVEAAVSSVVVPQEEGAAAFVLAPALARLDGVHRNFMVDMIVPLVEGLVSDLRFTTESKMVFYDEEPQ